VREVVRHNTIDLLGHTPVKTAQPGFDVGDRHGELRSSQSAGQGGVRVAADQEPVRPFAQHQLFDSPEHGAGLASMRTGADSKVDVRWWYLEPVEENAGHFVVIVLSRMHQDLPVCLSQLPTQRGRLDELGPRANNRDELHRSSSGTEKLAIGYRTSIIFEKRP